MYLSVEISLQHLQDGCLFLNCDMLFWTSIIDFFLATSRLIQNVILVFKLLSLQHVILVFKLLSLHG